MRGRALSGGVRERTPASPYVGGVPEVVRPRCGDEGGAAQVWSRRASKWACRGARGEDGPRARTRLANVGPSGRSPGRNSRRGRVLLLMARAGLGLVRARLMGWACLSVLWARTLQRGGMSTGQRRRALAHRVGRRGAGASASCGADHASERGRRWPRASPAGARGPVRLGFRARFMSWSWSWLCSDAYRAETNNSTHNRRRARRGRRLSVWPRERRGGLARVVRAQRRDHRSGTLFVAGVGRQACAAFGQFARGQSR
jgi:hypothetical protein